MKAFARAHMLMAALAAAITNRFDDPSGFEKALSLAASYESHGKGGKRAHRPTGIAGVKRQALKARNVTRNRRAHK